MYIRFVAQLLDAKSQSAGSFFRAEAKARNITVATLSKQALADSAIGMDNAQHLHILYYIHFSVLRV